MKATGIVRKVDAVGRFVLPMELRKTMAIEIYQEMEIYVEGKYIIISKYEHKCALCGGVDNLVEIDEKLVCHDCINEIKNAD
ncbi:MAG: AbrB/MazE/SpoVT family DNA-binding domain-containing protein [Defluviitaleaceae bacterium]|nr:AbrB/MazE/SpoVT family DNA-binding domain-containing protein [Defluviitaleaceae bacterium]